MKRLLLWFVAMVLLSCVTKGTHLTASTPRIHANRADQVVRDAASTAPVRGAAAIEVETLAKHDIFNGIINIDTPIHFDPEKGPIVGYLRKGTVVEIGRKGERPGWHFVSTGFPLLDSSGGFPRRPWKRIAAWIPHTVRAGALPVPELTQRGIIRFGLQRELLFEPAGVPFSFVTCGRVTMLGSDPTGKYLRVAAEFPSGELLGWMEAPESTDIDFSCGQSMLYGGISSGPELEGYFRAPSRVDEFVQFIEKGGHIYWGDGKPERRCSGWQFKATKTDEGILVQDHTDLEKGIKKKVIHYYFVRRPTFIILSCPETTFDDGGVMTNGCVWDYAVVRFRERNIGLIPWHAPSRSMIKSDENDLVAYRESKVLSWYRSREDCESSSGHDPEPRP